MSKLKIHFSKVCKLYLALRTIHIFNPKYVSALTIFETINEHLNIFTKPEDKIKKYWTQQHVQDYMEKADKLFEEEKYVEVYETLNNMKFSREIEVIWRIARALYLLSTQDNLPEEIRKQMIDEAFEVLNGATDIGSGKANFHKWMAIIIDAKYGLVSLKARIRNYVAMREHLVKACVLNPRDFTVQYMLGRWCFEMANLNWFQRKIAKYMFEEPPTSTYQEAYEHLNIAEELQPRNFIPNMCTLAKVCIKLGQCYRAKYYLSLALSLPAEEESDKRCLSQAKTLMHKLEKYDLGRDLLHENHFTFHVY